MFSSLSIRVLIRKTVHYEVFRSWKGYGRDNAKGLHSLQQFKRKRFIRPFKKNVGKKKEEIKDPKVYMRDTIGSISKILRCSMWDSAQEQLEKLAIRWDSYTINKVLKTHPPMEKAWLFFNWASRLKGFKHDQFTYTTMLDIFGEAGRISSMKYVFQQMVEKGINIDAVTYTSTLHWLSKDGDLEGALKMWEEMKNKGCCPTVVTYTAIMKILFDNNRPKEATEVYKEMLASGCSPNCYTYTILMDYLARTGKFREALDIMSKMQETGVQPDKAACNILVQRCSIAGETWAMDHVLQYMKQNALVLRHPVYLEALKALNNAGESDELLREANRHLSFESIYVDETSQCKTITTDVQTSIDRAIVINLLARRNFIGVELMLKGFIDKNIQLDSTLISAIILANCANYRTTCALLAFNYGIEKGIDIGRPTCLALMGILIRCNLMSELTEIVESMVGAGVSIGTYLLSVVIYKLGCSHMSASSSRIFSYLCDNEKNTATYTALMGAYISSGDVDRGLEIFDTMRRKGIHASSGTYRLLILGLKEAGRVHEAESYYKEKRSLQRTDHLRGTVSMEEYLCDLLFAGGVASC
ncbi:Pentatricopeptide repeat-containing protein [Thalictrum thalictroides]|uniref:Pentatricopeptide repeat-containing protein n=1 Tax=Thalictrum thalictroides TaxID=46969 RepID=A0A7J6X7H1_THATH|nr:Pentatricopeptide repeat-containing protein [Thalictrum thalictroides]